MSTCSSVACMIGSATFCVPWFAAAVLFVAVGGGVGSLIFGHVGASNRLWCPGAVVVDVS